MRRRALLVPALLLSVVIADGAGCRKDRDGRGHDMSKPIQSAPTLADLAQQSGVKFPPSARLVGPAREDGIDDLLRFKVEISAGDLPAFLATCPVPADAFEPGEAGLLGPDQGFWDPGRAKRLRTGQKILPGTRALNIGIDDGRPDVVAVYIVNHGT